MRILLLPKWRQKKCDLLSMAIKQLLCDKGYLVEEEIDPATKYDYMIAFDQKNMNRIKKVFGDQSKIIYITRASEAAREYHCNDVCIYKSFVFLDRKCHLNLSGAHNRVFMNMLAPGVGLDQVTDKADGDSSVIYIDIDNDMLNSDICLKILPLMNALPDYQIYLYTKNRTIAPLINKHIKIVNNTNEIAEYINRSDIVIGSGYAALLACKLKKKVIVVGERGYGGLVTDANVHTFYLNFFQGRNGGNLDEYVPLRLLMQDIKAVMDEQEKQLLSERLRQSEKENINLFLSMLEGYPQDADHADGRYTINPCYRVDKVGRYFYVIDANIDKRIKRINESECVIMLEFRDSNTIPALLNKYPVEYKEDICQFVQELIEKKYLVPYIKPEFTSQGHPLVVE